MSTPRDCVPLLRQAGMSEMAEWASSRPVRHGWKGRTCGDLWDASPRGDWLLAYAEAAGADRRDMVRAAVACVRPALRFVPEGEDRPRLAVEAAERWADEPTERNRKSAWRAGAAAGGVSGRRRARPRRAAMATYAAADAAADAAAGVARGAAAGAARGVAAWAEWDAAWALTQATEAHSHAHGHAEGEESEAASHRACADEVRRLVPFLELSAGGA